MQIFWTYNTWGFIWWYDKGMFYISIWLIKQFNTPLDLYGVKLRDRFTNSFMECRCMFSYVLISTFF